ncbi:Lrp/AsnC ligand binding domain-containing protein [Streptomyces sp. ISL-1]|uniref:Lrp/AsnC ligand binding domain-containing protein n=1 Tax=Streptomyces sp. ISL-1 TaxID=2817657 RepID=UPI0027E578BE|nr:Lrp/AsnC ligand binding domain-containing protein [Streptomyces sp. ISL-1]
MEGFREWAAQLPERIDLFVTSGPYDFLVHVAIPDVNGLYDFVRDRSPNAARSRTFSRR